MHRGRDRSVSQSAKARRRSEERASRARDAAAYMPPSSIASTSATSPRSPSRSHSPLPLTISDQVHIAYAADDIHLAKVLLLRLQGIEVTSDSDPRIATVKDEDFDACFIPFGGLDDGRGGLSNFTSTVIAPKSSAVTPAVQRAANLEDKESLWETEARRFTEERIKWECVRRHQSGQQRAMALEQERVRPIKQNEAAARRRMKPTARTLSFALVPAVPQPPPKFKYDFPFASRRVAPSPSSPEPRLSYVKKPEPRDKFQEEYWQPNRVTFQQVLTSMKGDLFPVLPDDRAFPSSAKSRRQVALFEALLAAGISLPPSEKGKERAIPIRCTGCSSRARLPLSPSTSSSSSSGFHRAGSWLSFGGSSRSSTASTSTTASSWASTGIVLDPSPQPKSQRFSASASVGTWLAGARRTTSPSPVSSTRMHVHATQCRCRDSARHPAPKHPLLVALPPPPRVPPHMRDNGNMQGALPFTLGRLATLARNLQAAYVRAVLVGYGGVSPAWDEPEDKQDGHGDKNVCVQERTKDNRRSMPALARIPVPRSPVPRTSTLQLRPPGMRASFAEVRRFLPSPMQAHSSSNIPPDSPSTDDGHPSASDDELLPSACLSQLAPRAPQGVVAPRTNLPTHLPYERVFAPPTPLTRTPWATLARIAATERGGDADWSPPDWCCGPDADSENVLQAEDRAAPWTQAPMLRKRAVTNSAFFRIKALHNAIDTLVYGGGLPMQPRRPREAVVVRGVDTIAGSRLRFVYAREVMVS
ncbi:hypothetical protein GGX14DRAFT_460458 [Mycena pura]|uniref:Uncharacterized protein n=1 Tax=Mycena pura TaxID=153505 RepID=A0AAD6VAQ1_9AGAR|nr:hypothetical protein GGX14DRAFT_460458 [Mycena pura]